MNRELSRQLSRNGINYKFHIVCADLQVLMSDPLLVAVAAVIVPPHKPIRVYSVI